jgi:hypothetical protein
LLSALKHLRNWPIFWWSARNKVYLVRHTPWCENRFIHVASP